MKIFSLIFLIIFLCSCTTSQVQTEVVTPQPTPTKPSQTTSSDILQTTVITPSPQKPTQIIVPPIESTEEVIDFPLWLKDPDTLVLASLIVNEVNQTEVINLINTESGEIKYL